MPNKRIVTGQHVPSEMLARARELRSEMTPAESRLWQRLRTGRLEGVHFRRQQIIGRFIVDFYCHQAGVVVEVDGGIHLEQAEYDQEREAYLREQGLVVLCFNNWEIEHKLDMLLGVILETCRDALTSP
jgi:very-short-patch-repair endonuclease